MPAVRAWWSLGLVAEVLLLGILTASAELDLVGWLVGLACIVAMLALFDRGRVHAGSDRPQPADWITLARAALAAAVAACVANAVVGYLPTGPVVVLSASALALDGLDGLVARSTGTASELGARFDMEVDAFLILVLSLQAARSFGGWVVAIGAARYALLAAEQLLPWLRRPVPPRLWRKAVAAIQGIVLTAAIAFVLPRPAAELLIAVALALLTESFGRDVWWLARQRFAAADRLRVPRHSHPVGASRG